MGTIRNHSTETIRKSNPHFSLKTTVETAFYSNNTREITSVKEAYELAKNAPQTIVLDATVKHVEELDLPQDANILLVNDGATVGRTAQA